MGITEVKARCGQIVDAYYRVKELNAKNSFNYRAKIDENYFLYNTSKEWVIMHSKTRERHAIKKDLPNELGRIIQLYFAQLNEEAP